MHEAYFIFVFWVVVVCLWGKTITMNLSSEQRELVDKLHSDVTTGLTTDQVTDRREREGYNVVRPPVDCPAWICCLLPCIRHVPSMKVFAAIRPEDAEILRNGRWIRYDASSLVTGDIVRLEEGDQVPADCVVLSVDAEWDREILVDTRAVTGEDKPRSSKMSSRHDDDDDHAATRAPQLYWGGTVVRGAGVAIVTATGVHTFVAGLIRDKRFPPTENLVPSPSAEEGHNTAEDEGITLIDRRETV